jgi:N-acetylglucosamine-6-phosphate deacetylase
MNTIIANIVTPKKIFEGEVKFTEKIISIKKISDHENQSLPFLLPGFIDLHIHGGGGLDIMDPQDPGTILATHAKFGTTSLLLTTVTSSSHSLKETFERIQIKKKNRKKNEAKILGIHLEGPFINKEKLGAQPNFVRIFDEDEIKKLNAISSIRIITLAPELAKNISYKNIIDQNIIIQIGHSNATFEETEQSLQDGAKSFTHLYNAMSGLHHRAPGVAGAALALGEYAELIPDLIHVHPGAIKVALRSIPKLYFVTDATSATGMPDGEFKLGSLSVSKCQNGVRLSDGTLAGSSLTSIDSFKNLISDKIGLSINEASYRLSTIPSELLNISSERGTIKENTFADLLLLDRNHNLLKVFIEGEEI